MYRMVRWRRYAWLTVTVHMLNPYWYVGRSRHNIVQHNRLSYKYVFRIDSMRG